MPGLTTFLFSALSLTSFTLASPIAQLVGRDTALLSSYDYVIVGGGTSGLIVGDRLSEDQSKTILVIESGNLDDGENGVLLPGMAGTTGSKYMYNMTSIPQPGMNNRTYSLLAAHVAGGGTVVNGMFFDRGSSSDYDLWESLGNAGWGWAGMLPYFKKSETFTPPDPKMAADFGIQYDPNAHGTSGPVQSSFPTFQYAAVKDWFTAFTQLGIKTLKDGASGNAIGAFWVPNSLDPKSQTRSYARLYYEASKERANYHILTGTTVTKLVLSGTTVTGVEFANGRGRPVTRVSAKKEVILAAGTGHTPQLLQLAGIGPKPLLQGLGIDVVVDLPGVGKNFQDHATLYVQATFSKDYLVNPARLSTDAIFAAEMMELYELERQGPYTVSRGNTVAFNTLEEISSRDTAVRIMESVQRQKPADYFPKGTDPTVIEGYYRQTELLTNYLSSGKVAAQEVAFGGGAGPAIALEKPFSRGTININTTDPWIDPVVDYGVLSNPADLDVFVEMVRFIWKLYKTPALQRLGAACTNPNPAFPADSDIRAAIKASVVPTFAHPCCTAPMMRREYGGVVSADLLVYGVKNLSIVDASIIPMIPATHIQSTVYAIAEKAADIIKARG